MASLLLYMPIPQKIFRVSLYLAAALCGRIVIQARSIGSAQARISGNLPRRPADRVITYLCAPGPMGMFSDAHIEEDASWYLHRPVMLVEPWEIVCWLIIHVSSKRFLTG